MVMVGIEQWIGDGDTGRQQTKAIGNGLGRWLAIVNGQECLETGVLLSILFCLCVDSGYVDQQSD
jgi:hypothetical protein